MTRRHDLVIAANRLPVRRVLREGRHEWARSPGGLVSALVPLVEDRGGAWVGWAGSAADSVAPFHDGGFHLHPVALSRGELDDFYYGFSNRTLWPLYHDAVRWPEYRRAWWEQYEEVNRRFAETIAGAAATGATVWVHDYHLQRVPGLLRASRPDLRIGFFLHVPFPPPELFARLPWRLEILEGLLGADVLGFQTRTAARNSAPARRAGAKVPGADPPRSPRSRPDAPFHRRRAVRGPGAGRIGAERAASCAGGRSGAARIRRTG
jgi:trehalose 6-phosphate synthase